MNINLGTICNYDDTYFYNGNFRNNYDQYREDANFLYYSALPNAKIGNRNKLLKRKKLTRNNITCNNRKPIIVRNNTRGINTNRNNRSINKKITSTRKVTPARTTRTATRKTVTPNRRTTSTKK